MKQTFRLFRRTDRGGTYYWENSQSRQQGSLRTACEITATRLLAAKNEAAWQPALNLELAKTYLAAHDPEMLTRNWSVAMAEMATHGITSTRDRCQRAFNSPAYDSIRDKPIVNTTAQDILLILHKNGNCVAHYLRRLHNLALDLGWLIRPVLSKRGWPKVHANPKRAITSAEHATIIRAEQNEERRRYYEILYETGAAQTDAANLKSENIDWANRVLVYHRRKLGQRSDPAYLSIGPALEAILRQLPRVGFLFPTIQPTTAGDRAAEFRRRCRLAQIQGISLHSYRYSWAQRAKAVGYPERFAQQALGHTSRAVHAAYARGGVVVIPPLDVFTTGQNGSDVGVRLLK